MKPRHSIMGCYALFLYCSPFYINRDFAMVNIRDGEKIPFSFIVIYGMICNEQC